ncbi:MAG: thermonuclease family protein [bacterium]|nr:thermonuclease family protein [bacterium]
MKKKTLEGNKKTVRRLASLSRSGLIPIKSGLTKAAAVATVSLAAASFLWLNTGGGELAKRQGEAVKVPAYSVIRVIDGDTFETAEHQYIRVASTEAPELELCGGPEAKTAMEKFVLEKPVYLKVVYRDSYQRLVSFVYVGDKFVNEAMLEGGYAYYLRGSPGEIGEELKNATEKARQEKAGIFGKTCTQMMNPGKPACDIKGNTRNGNIYYRPDCGVYRNVEVQLYLGDRWFCDEKEALAAGFRKPEQCP